MKSAEGIGRLGFKRWYERALIEAHVYLVTCFLGAVLALAALEIIGGTVDLALRILKAGLAVTGVMLAVYGWQRYRKIMVLAQKLVDRAVCPQCGLYAAFDVITFGPKAGNSEEEPEDFWLRAKCRQCKKVWTL